MTDLSDEDIRAFIQRVLDRICELAVDKARPAIPSSTLRDALAVVAGEDENTRYLSIPHYWAIYVHDGRGAFGPLKSDYLVWFRNKLDDPRTNYAKQFPVREGDIRRLTREQFNYCLELNKLDRAAGLRPRMVIAKFQPKIQEGSFFFSNLDVSEEFSAVVQEEFRALLAPTIPPDEQDEARLKLG